MSLPLSRRTWYGANVPGGKLDCLRAKSHAPRQRELHVALPGWLRGLRRGLVVRGPERTGRTA